MYDLRQFKPTLYALVILGLVGFAQAAELWTLNLALIGAILINGRLVYTGRFKPLPRWGAGLITLLMQAYVLYEIIIAGATAILPIAQFLAMLHVVKLYEQRSNRDYGQILVLSLLLMAAALMSSVSLLLGLIAMVYIVAAMYCCLLFHLKVETDRARAAQSLAEEKVSPAALRQDRMHLSRSMRRLTGLVAGVSVAMAAAVFTFFPRGSGSGMLGQFQLRPAEAQTGLSELVDYRQQARINTSSQVAAYVKVKHNGRLVEGGTPLLLRALTLDQYVPGAGWQRNEAGEENYESREISPYSPFEAHLEREAAHGDLWEQEVDLVCPDSKLLFALPGLVSLRPLSLEIRAAVDPRDQSVQSLDLLPPRFTYEAVSRNELGAPAAVTAGGGAHAGSAIDPRIEAYARRADVAGAEASKRGKFSIVSPVDGAIASAIETHLRTRFGYTLDLSDEKRGARDPLVAFLYDWRRGHCEYFAGAMTLMCQSLGMQARMVIGYKCDAGSYNSMGQCHIVRQSDAHAWVEVMVLENGKRRWRSYDPTSGLTARESGGKSLWSKVLQFVDYLQYQWAEWVVSYDTTAQLNLSLEISSRLRRGSRSVEQTAGWLGRGLQRLDEWVTEKLRSLPLPSISWKAAVGAAAAGGLMAIAMAMRRRRQMRRVAARMGLDALPRADKLRLARQLSFYEEMLRMLERRGIARAAHQTPREFGRSLSFLPGEAYDIVQRLTRLFYRIRFGNSRLQPAQHKRLAAVLSRLGGKM